MGSEMCIRDSYTNPEDIRPLFFRGTLRDGVLEVPARESGEVRG